MAQRGGRGQPGSSGQSSNAPVPHRGGSSTEGNSYRRLVFARTSRGWEEVYSLGPGPPDLQDVYVELELEKDMVFMDPNELRRSLSVPSAAASAMIQWVVDRPGRRLQDGQMDRWGFANSSRRIRGDTTQYAIKRVVLSDGKSPDFPAIGYFGSDRRRGGKDTFFEIDFYTLRIDSIPSCVVEPHFDDEPDADLTFLARIEMKRDSKMEARYLDLLDTFCLGHVNEFVNVYAPGDRPRSYLARRLRQPDKPTYCYSPEGQCMRATLVNALRDLDGKSAATSAYRYGRLFLTSLAELASWTERHLHAYRLPIPATSSNTSEWLLQQVEGIYLVRLEGRSDGGGSVDHVICINSGTQTVWDPAEQYGLRLTSETLQACIGNGFNLVGIMEIRHIQRQVQRREGAKKRRNNPEKRKMKRQQKHALKSRT